MTKVLHLVVGWGAPSQTFVRDVVLGVPGFEPVVVCEDIEGPRPPDIPIYRIGGLFRRLPGAIAGKSAIAITAAVGLRHRVALVHAHFGHELLLASRTARLLRRPLVVALHGRDLLVELDGAALDAARHAAAVVVPSPFLADVATAKGIPADRIEIIPSGIDLGDIAYAERRVKGGEAPLVLFVGRFVEKKGVLDAAAAVRRVADRHPLRARFIGTGPLESELRSALAPLGDGAEVVDGRDRAAVRQGLADAHVLLSPSRTAPDGDAETLLVVNLEAQAAGIPVVTTDHGGIPFAVDPAAGLLVAEHDIDALTAALAEVVSHPERWPAMGRAGRDAVEQRFTTRHTVEAIALLYHRLRAGTTVRAPKPSSC